MFISALLYGNPAVLGSETLLNSIDMYQIGILQTAYSKQSVSESGNGVLAAAISNVTSKILILLPGTSLILLLLARALRPLRSSFLTGMGMNADYLVTFSDDTDRANRIDSFSTVLAALNATAGVY